MTELDAMRRAIQLAWQGWGRVAPNPLVGAVVLREGNVIGEGFHAEFGHRHAEAAALEGVGTGAEGATLVVSLEPCAHHGKQPPCTELVIQHGLARVVVAMADPNPVAAGGLDLLRAHGITVELGVMQAEAESQNASFLHQFKGLRRPFVALKLSTSLDSRIADRAGSSRWISGPEAREYVHWLRAGFDAIGVGGRTARVDDASLTVRGELVPRCTPKRVVFTRTGELSPTSRLLMTTTEAPVILARSGAGSLGMMDYADAAGVTVIQGEELAELLSKLWQSGVTSILIEGGGELAGSLLAGGLVDRFYWIQAPVWLGDRAIPAFQGVPAPLLGAADRWHVAERRPLGADTLLVLDRR
ncbi:MAG: bifunctional diaminohydroxyphosphoribosylaminopyrimidine deaminase/5-amino-6-(5-phosphoribosylamino)uracil reductase RibD [Gemmatimonadota bacterium]